MTEKSDYRIAHEALRGIEDPLGRAMSIANTVNLLTNAVYEEDDSRVQQDGLSGLTDMTKTLVDTMREALNEFDSSASRISYHVRQESDQATEAAE